MVPKSEKDLANNLKFFIILDPFLKDSQRKQRLAFKSKAIAFTFRPFLATFFIFHKWAKNSKK
jgi:hypothetical protein